MDRGISITRVQRVRALCERGFLRDHVKARRRHIGNMGKRKETSEDDTRG